MFHVILFEPEIPPNTGNIIRLSANAGACLHLIKPLGFTLDDKSLQRASMDYAELAHVKTWDSLDTCLREVGSPRWFAITSRAQRTYAAVRYAPGDAFVFGPETRGLPEAVLVSCPVDHRLRIPMRPQCRSINLANSVAIVLYEAWRQFGHEGGQ